MNLDALNEAARNFVKITDMSERLCKKGDRSAPILCAFFVMLAALKMRLCLESVDQNESEQNCELTENRVAEHAALPQSTRVSEAAARLITSARSHDNKGITSELAEMGVIAFCPKISEQLARMRQVASLMMGRSQLILLVELALLAVELKAYDKALEFVAEARVFNPEGWELYSLHIVEGLVAFDAGKYGEAIQSMDDSILACELDEYTSLDCSVRGLNLVLVEKLLPVACHAKVTEHLTYCRDVWQILRPQIDVWISLIGTGEVPDFHASGIVRTMNGPLSRLQMQWVKGRSLEEPSPSTRTEYRARKSRAEVLEGRERLRAVYRRDRDTSKEG